ncbi:multicopper oxidase family protein [Crenothrix polyspora]|jgi:FtsP/CotA-like multicopper oxidase with cupredoxin domain|uniref:Multicopper oxidase family protein n=1 Tax=Crenothrix polyspora TaxID=360316 RepID=A0A1R4H3Y6_9GAMM|nr:multicopper oxidase family protein [Crenothrix polyspora]SJM90973.1 Multicopper oxidase family protein [Crenothrix polyspora]
MKIQKTSAILAGMVSLLATTCVVGGSITTIDPPRGAAFKDPVTMANISKIPGIVEVNLEAKIAPINVNGVTAKLMTYNGTYPAPTIKVKKGDVLKIHFKNSLPNSGVNAMGENRDLTNLHTHGLHVSPKGKSDNIMLSFKSGDTFNYEYNLSKQPGGNLNWYHPHPHGNSSEQVWGGMAGALEVADETKALAGYETHIMVLKDITLSGSAPAAYTMDDSMHGKEGNVVMVNGKVNPVLNMKPGQVQRWKIVNASNARFYKLSLASHNLQIIGTDGGLLDKPYPQSTILLSPGERIDIMVKASATKGYYKLLSSPYVTDDKSMMSSVSSSQKVTLLTVNVTGKAVVNRTPAKINNKAVRLNAPSGTRTRKITLDMKMMSGMDMMQEATINGIAYSPTKAYTVPSKLNTYEIWEVINDSGMDHPFHQHVNPAQVISITGGDTVYTKFYTTSPAWKDTVIVPKKGRIKLLVPIKDFTGTTMFHCHILEHEEMGMAGLWDIK